MGEGGNRLIWWRDITCWPGITRVRAITVQLSISGRRAQCLCVSGTQGISQNSRRIHHGPRTNCEHDSSSSSQPCPFLHAQQMAKNYDEENFPSLRSSSGKGRLETPSDATNTVDDTSHLDLIFFCCGHVQTIRSREDACHMNSCGNHIMSDPDIDALSFFQHKRARLSSHWQTRYVAFALQEPQYSLSTT